LTKADFGSVRSISNSGLKADMRRRSTKIVALEHYIRPLDDGCQPFLDIDTDSRSDLVAGSNGCYAL